MSNSRVETIIALKVAVRYYCLYGEAHPDVGFGPMPEDNVNDVLDEAKIKVTDKEHDELTRYAKKWMRGWGRK